MKKLIALLMVLVMFTLCLASCGEETPDVTPCEIHVDMDLNGKCDVCQTDVEPIANDTVGLMISDAIVAQLEKSESAVLEIDIDLHTESDEWEYDGYDPNTNSYTETINEKEYFDGKATLKITFSKTDTGANFKVEIDAKSREAADAEFEETISGVQLYFIDGVMYQYNDEYDAFFRREVAVSEEVLATLENVFEGVGPTEEETDAVLTELGKLLITLFGIQNNVGVLSYDAKPIVEDLQKYFADLDLTTATLETVVDDLLALVNKDLTAEALLEEFARVGGLKVSEALAELDEALTDKYGTTLQGIYDTIANDVRVQTLITNILTAQGKESEEITATITSITAFKIAEAIPAEMLDVPLYDVIMSMATQPDEEGNVVYDDLETFVEGIGAILDVPLEVFEEEIIGASIFSFLKENLAHITLNELNGRTDILFAGLFEIGSVTTTTNVDFSFTSPSGVEDKEDFFHLDATVKVALTQISQNKVPITIPADETVYYDVLNRYIEAANGDDLYMSESEGKVNLSVTLNRDGVEVTCYASNLDISVLENTTITVPGNQMQFVYNGRTIPHDSTTDLVIEMNVSEGTFTVVSCPTYEVPLSAEDAIRAIGFGEGVDNSDKYDVVDGIYFQSLGYDSNSQKKVTIIVPSGENYTHITATYTVNIEGKMECTIYGFGGGTDISYYFVDENGEIDTTRSSWCGGTYDETVPSYFGGNITFTIYVDENNVVTYDELPHVADGFVKADNRVQE